MSGRPACLADLGSLVSPGMQLLWELLPGAREARNQLVIGYAWVGALALWIGVPELPSGNARDLLEAIGPVGTGIAVSFAAFMLGSFAEDVLKALFGLRGAQALTLSSSESERLPAKGLFSRAGSIISKRVKLLMEGTRELFRRRRAIEETYMTEEEPLLLLRRMEEPVRAELERLEIAIDRLSSEVTLRLSLLAPLAVAALPAVQELTVSGSNDNQWGALIGFFWLVGALIWQITRRRNELLENLENSRSIRERLRAELLQDTRQAEGISP